MEGLSIVIGVVVLVAIGHLLKKKEAEDTTPTEQPKIPVTEQPEIPVEIQEQMRAKVVNSLLIFGGNMYKISEIELIERKTGNGFGPRSLLRFKSGAELYLLHAYHPSLPDCYFMPEDEIMQFMIKG